MTELRIAYSSDSSGLSIILDYGCTVVAASFNDELAFFT